MSQHVKPGKVENKDARQVLNDDSSKKPRGYGGLDILSNDIVQAVMDEGDVLQWCKLQVLEMEKMIPCSNLMLQYKTFCKGKMLFPELALKIARH